MISMNSPQRAEANATARARVHLGRLAAAVVTAAAMLCFSADPAHAMTRTTRPHARSVAQEQEPGPSHSRAHQKKGAASSSHKAAAPKTSKPGKTHKDTASATRTHGKGHHAKPVPEPDDDPISMKRASRGTERRHHEEPAPVETAAAPHRATHHAKSEPAPTAVAAIERKAPDTGDFIRAATGMGPGEAGKPSAYAEGVSHPDDMDDPASLSPVIRKPAPRVSAVDTAATTPAPAPERVDGFGAEGDNTQPPRRTLARTMATLRAEHAKAPVISGAEQNEITDEAVKPMVVPAVFTRGGRIVMPAPLKGSRDVLVHQNLMADHDGLERIQDDAQLDELLDSHQLARLPETGSLHVNPDLPENRRYARPWTVKFASDTAHAYANRFGVPLQVNSAVRTVTYQLRLMRVNGNAAAVDGDTASPHLTGQAIDIGKRGMSKAELAWMRAYLLPLMQAGKVDVEEEFQQACFHISVYRSYMPAHRKMQVAQVTRRAPVDSTDTPDSGPATADDSQ